MNIALLPTPFSLLQETENEVTLPQVGSKEKVDALTEKIREHGHPVIGEPRTTGDGYYESVVSDPEGNWIEITV